MRGIVMSLLLWVTTLQAQWLNGFDLSQALVGPHAILHGGPPRDGIPAIDAPHFLVADKAKMRSEERVLGLDGTPPKAYPVRILNWHEIVNDKIDARAIVVSFCPLCGSGMVFDAQMDKQHLQFAVSGLLYNSDVLMFDRQTESLWSQILGQAISGPLKGRRLRQRAVEHTSWSDWLRRHPDTLVLSDDTGHTRDYADSPYLAYAQSEGIYFPVQHRAPPPYHPKERVLGLSIGGQSRAYPFVELERHGQKQFEDTLAGQRFRLHWDRQAQAARAHDENGQLLPGLTAFWFAWYAFHPDTQVWKAPAD